VTLRELEFMTELIFQKVYVATNPQVRFMNGDIVLVCDAGGGTTYVRKLASNRNYSNFIQRSGLD
jgi:hypothetical protein